MPRVIKARFQGVQNGGFLSGKRLASPQRSSP